MVLLCFEIFNYKFNLLWGCKVNVVSIGHVRRSILGSKFRSSLEKFVDKCVQFLKNLIVRTVKPSVDYQINFQNIGEFV